MKRITLCLLLSGMLTTSVVLAQQSVKSVDQPAQPNFVFDDDGGAVQVVPSDLAPTGPKQFHGGAVLKSVQQMSIFLGSGWGDEKVRTRQTALFDLLAGAQSSELQAHHIKSLPAGPKQEDFSRVTTAQLNDLAIQRRLADMLRDKALAAPTASTVFVIFLAPEVNSIIGPHQGGTDYAAYHNFFHTEAGEVRYIVVPFDANAENHRAAATRGLIEAALNPHGDGWF